VNYIAEVLLTFLREKATREGAGRVKKFAGLEICRFLCAASVIVWHYQHFFAAGILDDSILPVEGVSLPLYSVLKLALQ